MNTDKPAMRVVSEPRPPLDDDGELLLDGPLELLAEQLRSESQLLARLADVESSAGGVDGVDGAQLSELEPLASQLRADAQRLAAAAGLPASAQPEEPAADSTDDPAHKAGSAWLSAAMRIVPLAAAAVLAIVVLRAPLTEPAVAPRPMASKALSTDAGEDSAARAVPSQTSPSTLSVDDSDSIPWQEMSSPELEGALDLVDGFVSISI